MNVICRNEEHNESIVCTEAQPEQTITEDLFYQYVDYIDRSSSTTRSYLINLRQFAHYMSDNGITQPTKQNIRAYRDSLKAKGYKANTITAYMRSVKMFFHWTAAAGLYPDVTDNVSVPTPDAHTHKKDALQPTEVCDIEASIEARADEKIMEAAMAEKDTAGRIQRSTEQGKRLYAMYLLCVNAGLRCCELSRANVKDFEQKGQQSWLWIYGKGHTEADVKKPIAHAVAAAVRDYLNSRTDGSKPNSPLFVATGNRNAGGRIAPTTISRMLKAAMTQAGYCSDRLTAHSLRHTTAVAIQELTGDLTQTKSYLRHESIDTTMIYLNDISRNQEAQTAEDLYEYYHIQQKQDMQNQTGQLLAALIQNMTTDQQAKLLQAVAVMG